MKGSMKRRISEFAQGIGHSLPAQPSTLDAPRRIIDIPTGLPSLTSLFAEMRGALDPQRGATVIYFHLASNTLIEEHFGWEALAAYNELVHTFLSGLSQQVRRERGSCVVARAFADDYVALMPAHEGDDSLPSPLADRINRHIRAVDEELATINEVYVGRAHVPPFGRVHPERMIYRAIQRAQTVATDISRQRLATQVRLLDRCIDNPSAFSIVYQPLVRLADNSIFAYEGLARCSLSELRNPHVLFNVAEQGDRVWPLSRILRRKAVEPAADLPRETLLFINLHPADFEDPELLAPDPALLSFASRIVLEITERAAITDFPRFRRNVDRLREFGLRIAVDDLGAGYAALSAVAELQPDFLKFDITLIRDIDRSPMRQNLIRNMVSYAADAKAQVVAEGVETAEELQVVGDLGCDYVQGYYMARPGPTFIQDILNA